MYLQSTKNIITSMSVVWGIKFNPMSSQQVSLWSLLAKNQMLTKLQKCLSWVG